MTTLSEELKQREKNVTRSFILTYAGFCMFILAMIGLAVFLGNNEHKVLSLTEYSQKAFNIEVEEDVEIVNGEKFSFERGGVEYEGVVECDADRNNCSLTLDKFGLHVNKSWWKAPGVLDKIQENSENS